MLLLSGVEIQVPHMVFTEEPVRTRGWGGEISLPAGGEGSLSFLLGLFEHHSGAGVGVPLQPGRVKVEAPHWPFVGVDVLYENFIFRLPSHPNFRQTRITCLFLYFCINYLARRCGQSRNILSQSFCLPKLLLS